MDNIYKAVQLTIDSQNLALSKTPTHVYIANQYVDTNDTPLITAPFIIQKALENGTGVVDIVSSTIGSIYEVRLLCDAEVLISGYFYMPPMNAKFSELELYTSYPPRTPPVINEFWQKTENFILEKTNTLLNFVQVFNAVSSMRLSLGYLEELLTIKKSNLVSAINEVVSVKANKATTLVGYGITDAYTKSEIDADYSGIKTLYDKNVEAGAGENGWTDLLTSLENGRTQREKNKDRQSIFDFLTKDELTQWRSDKQSFDWSPVAKRAFEQFKVQRGGKLYIPLIDTFYNFNGIQGADGKWVGIQIPSSQGGEYGYGIAYGLEGECPEVTLRCGRDDMIMIRHSASYSDVKNFTIRPKNIGSNKNIAYAVTPENWTSPDGYASSHNNISNIFIHNVNRGLILFCGSKGASCGGAYYNTFLNIHVTGRGDSSNGNVSAYELLSPVKNVGDTNLSPPNRNVFINCKAFFVNRGFYIQSGDTNRFFGCSMEGVNQSGEFETTPTALRVDKTDPVTKFDNINNQFFGFITEACTQDAVIDTAHIKIFGHTLEASKSIVTEDIFNSYACTITGGSDATTFPDIVNGSITILGNTPKNWSDTRKVYGRTDTMAGFQAVFDVNGKQRTFDITSSNSTGLGLIKGNRSVVSKFNKFVDLTAIFAFNPAAADSVITIDLPFIANRNVYYGNADSWNSTYNFLFNISVGVLKADNSAYTFAPHIAELLANNDGIVDKIRIRPPTGGWKYFSSNQYTGNMINFHVRYRVY